MYIKSPYPDLPATPGTNVFNFLWDRPDQAQWPDDLTFHIDAKTGHKRTYREFRERVHLSATALDASSSEGGLEIRDGDVVAIVGENSSVSFLLLRSSEYDLTLDDPLGLCCLGSRSAHEYHSLCRYHSP